MRLALILFFLLCAPVFAAQEVEIIELRHRLVEDVMPVLEPLLEPGGAMTGMNGHLVLRASPANLRELRQVLAVVDRPPRQLVIRVSQTRDESVRQRQADVSGRVRVGQGVDIVRPGAPISGGGGVEVHGGGSFVGVYGKDARRVRQSAGEQFVRVLDGSAAFISIGRSLAVPFRRVAADRHGVTVSRGVVYVDVGQGFTAVPRLTGDAVSIEISPFSDRVAGPGLDVETQRLSTTVTGRLGEWIELGGGEQREREDAGQLAGAASSEGRDTRSVWLLVEEER